MKTRRLALTFLGGAAAALLAAGCASDRYDSDRVGVMTSTPPPPVETLPAQPGRDYMWNAHSWAWQPDRWITRPAGRDVWVPGAWVQTSQGWVWKPGRWE